MAELETIVTLLNAAPFEMGVTMVALDTQSFSELFETIIVKVCHKIDETQISELKSEESDSSSLVQKVFTFIKLLNYEPTHDSFRQHTLFLGTVVKNKSEP